jgi:predicted dehydrogenase
MQSSLPDSRLPRRHFLRNTFALGALPALLDLRAATPEAAPATFERRVKLGVVACGGRGSWIARLFARHGGYTMHAVADYFPAVAHACGEALGVPANRRFSGLDGYRRVLESGVEAVALEAPPGFFPEHARAAVEAGVHVYMAKPVAIDVPGCLTIEQAARTATDRKQVFFVDYQMPTDEPHIEIVRRIHAGMIGPVAVVNSQYYASTFPDPPFTDSVADRLQHLTWCNDNALGGGYHVNACIHAVDAALWVIGQRPVAATGFSRAARPDPHGDSHDVFSLLFEFPDGLILDHRGKHLPNQTGFDVYCQVQGRDGHAQFAYGGKAWIRSNDDAYQGESVNLYEAGAVRNIATFYDHIVAGRRDNPTVRRSVDGALTTILGREAGRRRTRLTMTQLLQENTRLELDLRGLKA